MGDALAGRRRWIWLAAAVVVVALVVAGVVRALGAGAQDKPVAAPTAQVDRGAVTTAVATTGTVQPAQTRSLSFSVAGTVESISVRAGTTVSAGLDLAKVDDTDAAAAVANARASLDDAEDSLTEARADASKTSTATTSCGANVAAAYTTPHVTASPSPSVTASPRPTRTATAAPTRTATAAPTRTATAAPTTPHRTAAPGRTTAPGGATTPGRAGGAGSGNSGGGSGSGCTAGGQSGGEQSGGQQGSGQQSGGEQSGSQQGSGQQGGDAILSAQQRVTQATTTLENAEDALEGATITAPIAGRILSVTGKVGNQVGAGSVFITLADTYDMQISAAFPEADADRLAERQKAVVTLADQAGKDFAATVVQVDPTGTSDGTMVRYGVLLSFDEAPKDLLVGQSANVRVTTGSKAGVLRVPSSAVHDVAGAEGTVLRGSAQVKVGIGLRGDQYTEVTSGLTDGESVVRSW